MFASELARQLETKRGELKALFDGFKTDGNLNVPTDKIAEIESRNTELADLNTQYVAAKSLELAEAENAKALGELKSVNRLPIANVDEKPAVKSFGELAVDSGAFKGFKNPMDLDIALKTVMSTGAGYAPWSPRDNVVTPYPLRQLSLLDVIPQLEWGYAAYLYMEETTHTNNAAEKAESVQGTLAAYGEGAIAFTERTVTVRDIGVFLPVTDQQLEDVPGMVNILNDRLGYMVRNRYEGQLIAGDGNAPNIAGILNTGSIQTQAKGSDAVPDAIYKAITKVRAVGFAEPTHILLHPNDFQDVRILQNTTGQYVFEGGLNFGGPATLFGIPVILSTAVTENTGIVLDMSYLTAVNRRGVTVELDRMGDDLKNGMKTVRATLRGALAVYRPKAICKVTGI